MSLAAREALNKLISNADVQQFAIHAEDWSACSTTAVLAASADKLGELAEQRAYKDDVGRTRQDWRERRADLQRCLVLSRRRQLAEARELLIQTAGVWLGPGRRRLVRARDLSLFKEIYFFT